jgi:hypothetical protein
VLWSGGAALSTIGEAEVLLAAGDLVLIDERRQERHRSLRWHCRLSASTLHQHPLWPVLFQNLIQERRTHLPGPAVANLPASAPLRGCLPVGMRSGRLIGPEGELVLQADSEGLVDIPALRHPGLYRLQVEGRELGRLNVLALDPRMSDLSACRDLLQSAATPGSAAADRRRSESERLLPLLLAAAAALCTWLAWQREERLVGREPQA